MTPLARPGERVDVRQERDGKWRMCIGLRPWDPKDPHWSIIEDHTTEAAAVAAVDAKPPIQRRGTR